VEKAINDVGKSYASIKNAEKDLYNIKLGFSHSTIIYRNTWKQTANSRIFEMSYKERDAIARMRAGAFWRYQSFYTISKDARDMTEAEAAIKVERRIMEDANKRLEALAGKPSEPEGNDPDRPCRRQKSGCKHPRPQGNGCRCNGTRGNASSRGCQRI